MILPRPRPKENEPRSNVSHPDKRAGRRALTRAPDEAAWSRLFRRTEQLDSRRAYLPGLSQTVISKLPETR